MWAGPPDTFVSDNERGLISKEVWRKFNQTGTAVEPTAAHAPWQKGKVERKIRHAKEIMRKTIKHLQVMNAGARRA